MFNPGADRVDDTADAPIPRQDSRTILVEVLVNTTQAAGPVGTSRVSAKTWITGEATRMMVVGEIREGIRITDFAKELKERMDKAAKVDRSLHPVGWLYIKNQLPDWGLWPIKSIK
jgi:hypothetical protein